MFERIVVGVSQVESATRAAQAALALAEISDARETKAATQAHVLPGDPADVILQVAREVDADLIVVGNRGMHGARRVLGSVPNTLSHHADCSVLIVQTV